MISEGLWPEGYRAYAAKIAAASMAADAWQKRYEDRRGLSHEERVVRQVSIENAWCGTPVEGVWSHLRMFALPSDNYQMDRAKLSLFARSAGVTSTRLRDGITELFFDGLLAYNHDGAQGCINGLHVCKAIEVSLENGDFRDALARHCFDDFTRAISGEPQSKLTVHDLEARLQKAAAESEINGTACERSSAEFEEALKSTLAFMDSRSVAELDSVLFADVLCSPRSPPLMATFTKHVLEVCAHQLKPPFGCFPTLPLQWLNSVTAIPYNQHYPGDSDSLLLQQLEQGGRLRRRLHIAGTGDLRRGGKTRSKAPAKKW